MAIIDNLVSWWALDEASGNALDSHGGNDLTETGGTIDSSTGKVGNCRDFEAGDTEYFEIADNADLSVGDIDFTFAGWVNLESTAGDQAIFSKYDPAGDVEYGLFISGGDLQFLASPDGSAASAILSNVTINSGTWYFVACWHDATTNRINICVNDGAVQFASYSSGVFNGATPFRFGDLGGAGGFPLDGKLDEWGFWKRVLTSAEITELYNSGNGRSYSSIATPAPTLSSIDPATGTVAGGTEVTLTGTDLTDASSVTFGGDAATSVTVVNDTTVTCVTPAHAAGAVDVVLTTPGGNDTLVGGFTYADVTAPTASSWATNTDGNEITATLSEADCTPASGTGGFTLGGTSATVASWAISGTTLTLTLSGTVYQGQTVTISYNDATASEAIADAADNLLADLSGVSVTNNSTVEQPASGRATPTSRITLGIGI